MSRSREEAVPDDMGSGDRSEFSRAELSMQVDLLLEESYRLRSQLERERRQRDVRAAVGFGLLGVAAVGGGLLLPDVRATLLAIGATGLFAALFVAYLGSCSLVSEPIEEEVYAAAAANAGGLLEELELRGPEVYVPFDERTESQDVSAPVRLFVPQRADYSLPDEEVLRSTRIVADGTRTRGLVFVPTGGILLNRLREDRAEPLEREREPLSIAKTLTRELVDHFELVRDTQVEETPDERRISIAVSGSRCGTVDRIDHPVSSFLGAGLATAMDQSVTVDVSVEDERADFVVTCHWDES